MRIVDLLCSDSWGCNMGDVATALLTANGMAQRGVPVRRVAEYKGLNTIVGGGNLLGNGPNSHLYQPKGQHLLNAVGVYETPTDIAYLKDYAHLSVRDYVSAEHLGLADIHVVPCPATLIEPVSRDVACNVPRWGLLKRFVRGEYVVIHAKPEFRGIANGATEPVIAIEPAPCSWMPWDANGWLLPWTHAPELIAAVVADAKAVVTISLHLSILAMAMGTPFCCPRMGTADKNQKVEAYWTRAGFPEVMYNGPRPVAHALAIRSKLQEIMLRERSLAAEHLNRLAETCRQL